MFREGKITFKKIQKDKEIKYLFYLTFCCDEVWQQLDAQESFLKKTWKKAPLIQNSKIDIFRNLFGEIDKNYGTLIKTWFKLSWSRVAASSKWKWNEVQNGKGALKTQMRCNVALKIAKIRKRRLSSN